MSIVRPFVAALLAAVLVTSGCSKDDDGGTQLTPAQAMAEAKKALDETSGVHLELLTPALPDGVSGVVKADGIANHQPAFVGTIDLVYSGFTGTVPVTSVDGVVYAILPFTNKYVDVDPADYGAPDPADLMDPATGVSSWLTQATGLVEGDQVRDGADLLTSYHGTLAGSAVVRSIPSADGTGDFDATFTLDVDGRLRSASLTGVFYKGKPALTYVVTITQYATQKDITAP
jgi:lipoprotein LprG